MDPEIKVKWLAALRDGSYKQAKQKLRHDDFFCCLGVLCDIVDPSKWVATHDGFVEYGAHQWALPPSDFLESVGLSRTTANDLSGMNDSGKSFLAIAEIIEKDL